jgi:hypothetical protein
MFATNSDLAREAASASIVETRSASAARRCSVTSAPAAIRWVIAPCSSSREVTSQASSRRSPAAVTTVRS